MATLLIKELTIEQSLEVLGGISFGRLACSQGGQPYIVPINFALDGHYLYGFCMMGKKVEWMRANPLVCVEADQISSPREWVSIVVSGKYEELPNTDQWASARSVALELVPKDTKWWEPWPATILQGSSQAVTPLFYRIQIVEISGRQAIPDGSNTDTNAAALGPVEPRLLQRILKYFRPKSSHAGEKNRGKKM